MMVRSVLAGTAFVIPTEVAQAIEIDEPQSDAEDVVEAPAYNSTEPTPLDRTASDDGYSDRIHVNNTGGKYIRPYLNGRRVYGAFECDRREGWIRALERTPDNFTLKAKPTARLTTLRGDVQWIVIKDGEQAPDQYPG